MGLFGRAKPKAEDRIVSDLMADGGDGFYETDVRGEAPHRGHLVSVLGRHERAPGWDVGRVSVTAYLVPLGVEQYGNFAVEVDGVQVGFVADSWVKLFGETYTRAAGVASRPVVFRVPAAICWSVSRGNPLRDESVPLGVRLDLQDEAEVARYLERLD